MTFSVLIATLGCISSILSIVFAVRARCWLLVAGYISELAIHGQVLFRRLGIILSLLREEAPPYSVNLNRSLWVCSLVLITAGIIQLLQRRTRMRSPPPLPQSQL